eukprot:CAMPEP_0198206332 /NCGR_PEP_ID=MMETSP1445-20131203/9860_1 /TAXON_ID=36898 /ORGANISM="Pyramimonas sp., Strain CCMP2087" /LENGTH=299 /DNA_ID=CAMNT_0043878987 /DNA_START=73 /DNA_END=969 /DNA_ORIENTATION=+
MSYSVFHTALVAGHRAAATSSASYMSQNRSISTCSVRCRGKGCRSTQRGVSLTPHASKDDSSGTESAHEMGDDKVEKKGIHWSNKSTGRGETRDDLRYMDKGALKKLGKGLPFNIQSVVRDRDNVTFVGNESLIGLFLADELGAVKEEAAAQLQQLYKVLPALAGSEKGETLRKVGVPRLASFCADLPGLGNRIVQLKRIFPSCDVDTMVCDNPFLLTDSVADLRNGLDALRVLFPFAGENGTPTVDRMAQAVPQLLDPEFSKAALVKLGDVFGEGAADMVHRNPFLVLRVESAFLRSR